MTRSLLFRGALTVAVTALALAAAGCTSDDSAGSSAGSSSTRNSPGSGSAAPAGGSAASAGGSAASAPASGQPFGPACAALPGQGPGSLAAIANVPVVTAAAAEPQLSGFLRTVTAANLVESLNSQQNVTVFAPVDSAFQALPTDQVRALLADVPRLTAVLTHHVVQGRLAPGQLAGRLTTLDNDTVTIAGSGQKFTVSGSQTLSGKPATIVCGNLRTANATVYLIDQVLKPQATG